MSAKFKQEAQNPLILRCHRLMDAFAKSDDERDFYIDRLEGFLIYVDLDKPLTELDGLETELNENRDRYCAIPKLTFYETKKIMEGFVNEKVYDIDTKEKLLDIIQSKEARENFLEFIYDHHAEQEKWQQFYQERSRIRIIEWLRQNHFHFVFEEDLELPRQLIEKLKHSLFQPKVGKDIQNARKTLFARAKTYYSNEALNPRPKRGRPPKQAVKPDIEPQITLDIYTTVPPSIRPFLFTPEIHTLSGFSAFSSKFEAEEDLLGVRRFNISETDASLSHKLASLRALSNRWIESPKPQKKQELKESFDDEFEDEEDEEDEFETPIPSKRKMAHPASSAKKVEKTKEKKEAGPIKKGAKSPQKPKAKRIMPKQQKLLKKIVPKKKS